ncbi:15798_t:CDS:1, partial [Dentiscutata heterogama]
NKVCWRLVFLPRLLHVEAEHLDNYQFIAFLNLEDLLERLEGHLSWIDSYFPHTLLLSRVISLDHLP